MKRNATDLNFDFMFNKPKKLRFATNEELNASAPSKQTSVPR